MSIQQVEIAKLKNENASLKKRIELLEKMMIYDGNPIISENGIWQGSKVGLKGDPGPNIFRRIATGGNRSCKETCYEKKLRCVAAWAGSPPYETWGCSAKPEGNLDCLCVRI